MLLFLDFDGVVCDSAIECLASSWIAYHRHYRKEEPDQSPVDLRARFLALRPFIRGGPDFLVIQDLLAKGGTIADQNGFDAYRNALGKGTLQEFAALLDRVRQEMLASQRQYWLTLNHLFAPVQELLGKLDWEQAFILSTKRRIYIREILTHNGVVVPYARVLHSGARSKLEVVSTMLDLLEEDRAVLVDDQRDHLVPCPDPRIQPYLARWGYVKPEWRHLPDPPGLDATDLESLLSG